MFIWSAHRSTMQSQTFVWGGGWLLLPGWQKLNQMLHCLRVFYGLAKPVFKFPHASSQQVSLPYVCLSLVY